MEQKLLAKTREVLKNRLFLLLNKFYKNMDKDKRDKEGKMEVRGKRKILNNLCLSFEVLNMEVSRPLQY